MVLTGMLQRQKCLRWEDSQRVHRSTERAESVPHRLEKYTGRKILSQD